MQVCFVRQTALIKFVDVKNDFMMLSNLSVQEGNCGNVHNWGPCQDFVRKHSRYIRRIGFPLTNCHVRLWYKFQHIIMLHSDIGCSWWLSLEIGGEEYLKKNIGRHLQVSRQACLAKSIDDLIAHTCRSWTFMICLTLISGNRTTE